MSQPLGHAVGNALEIREAVDTIRGAGPADFTELVLDACARLLALSDLGIDVAEGRARAEAAVADGSALAPTSAGSARREETRALERLPVAPVVRDGASRRVPASCPRLDALAIGIAALELGAGRRTKADAIDHAGRRRLPLPSAVTRSAPGASWPRCTRRTTASAATAVGGRPRRVHARRRAAARRTTSSSTSSGSRPVGTRAAHRRGRGARLGWTDARAARGRDRSQRPSRRCWRARVSLGAIDGPRLVRPFAPEIVAAELVGERVEAVERRGKYLIVRFESGRVLLIHLRMTGSLRHARSGTLADDPHRRAVLTLDNGSDVAYRDVRRFGTWELLEPGELDRIPRGAARPGAARPHVGGPARARGSRGRRAPLKAALLDQRTLAGLGNIYVDEALWYARLHPLRPAGGLDQDELRRLTGGSERRSASGSSGKGRRFATTRDPDGESGAMQDEFRVYGRDGEPCGRCRTPIAKTRVGGPGHALLPPLPGAGRRRRPRRPRLALVAPLVHDRGGRPALVPVRRGRPRAAPLHARPRAGSERSPRVCGRRSRASAAGWSRSRTSSSCCTTAAASSTRSRARRSSARTTARAPTRTACRSG